MPRSRYVSRKRKSYGGPMASSSMAKRARFSRKVTSYVRRTPKGELRMIDFNQGLFFDNVPASSSPVVLLNGMAAGAAMWQRNGRKAITSTVYLQYTIQPYTLPSPTDRLKVALVWDRYPNGSLPTVADIFKSRTNAGVAITDVESSLNLDNRERFRILHHKIYNVGYISSGGYGAGGMVERVGNNGPDLSYRRQIRVGLPTTFRDDDSTIASISGGSMYIVCFAETTTFASAAWQLHLNARVSVKDN